MLKDSEAKPQTALNHPFLLLKKMGEAAGVPRLSLGNLRVQLLSPRRGTSHGFKSLEAVTAAPCREH